MWRTHVNLKKLVDVVVHYQTMRKPDAMGLHRMAGNVGIVTNVGVVEVGHLLLVIVDDIVERLRALDAGWVGRHRDDCRSFQSREIAR